MGECGLYLGRQERGRLTWEGQTGKLRLRAACSSEEGLIYRVVLQTDGGIHRLGVMLPEGEQFLLCRDFPAGEAPLRAFIDRTLPGEAHLPGLPLARSAFSPAGEDFPPELLAAWWMDEEYFLFPFKLGEACPLISFLCLSTMIEGPEESYGVFCRKKGAFCPLEAGSF